MSIARHTAYNFAGATVPIVVSLVTVPLYLSIIGLDRYGVLSICWLLLGYFNLFDFGLGRATAQKIATLADAAPADRSRTFWTALGLSAALSVVAMLLFAPAAHYGLSLMNLESEALRGEFDDALPWLVASLPFGVANSLLVGALEGRRAFLKINLIVTAGTVATATLPLASAIMFGPNLAYLLAASLTARAVVVLLLFFACWKTVPALAPTRPGQGEVGLLLKFGGWTTITSIVGPLLVFWDRFAIGAVISSAAVALYVVPFNLVSQLQLLPSALSTALFPRLAAASPAEARQLSLESIEILAFILTPITLVILMVTGPFLLVWLGPQTSAASIPVAYILLGGLWANSLAKIPASELQAQRRPHALAITHLAELIPYAILLYFAMRAWGIAGAALAWSARCVADAVILYVLVGAARPAFKFLAPHALLLALSVATAYLLPLWSWPRWAALTALLIACVAIVLRKTPPRIASIVRDLKARLMRRSDEVSS